jgi:hypothetical protein
MKESGDFTRLLTKGFFTAALQDSTSGPWINPFNKYYTKNTQHTHEDDDPKQMQTSTVDKATFHAG